MSKILLDTNTTDEFEKDVLVTNNEKLQTTYNDLHIDIDVVIQNIEHDNLFWIECGINATQLAKHYKKELKRFLELNSTKIYIDFLLKKLNEPLDSSFAVLKGLCRTVGFTPLLGKKVTLSDLFITKGFGANKATWIYNKQLVLRFLGWLSVDFQYAMDLYFTSFMIEKQVTLEENDRRYLYKTLSDNEYVNKLEYTNNTNNGKNINKITKQLYKTDDEKGRSKMKQIRNLIASKLPNFKMKPLRFIEDLAYRGFITRIQLVGNRYRNIPTSRKIGIRDSETCSLYTQLIIDYYVKLDSEDRLNEFGKNQKNPKKGSPTHAVKPIVL